MAVELRAFSWDRMIEAVQAVRDRALRATRALENAGIPYAMAGGNAVAAWVARVDRAAVRNTQDVDLLVRRSDLPAITTALEAAGFVRATVMDVVCFIDGISHSPGAVFVKSLGSTQGLNCMALGLTSSRMNL